MALLADRVRERREALGYTQEQLAQEAGVGQSSVARIESGDTTSPRIDTLAAIARVLKCSPAWLQGEEEAIGPPTDAPNQTPPSTEISDFNTPTLGNLPGWAEIEKSAKKKAPDVDAWVWDELREANPLVVSTIHLTVSSLIQLARLTLEHGKPPKSHKK
jgi:transcriptional regulator with XRE-family HTH domain